MLYSKNKFYRIDESAQRAETAYNRLLKIPKQRVDKMTTTEKSRLQRVRGGDKLKCWYAKTKKKERAETKAALKKFMEQIHEEALKEASAKAAEEKQSESEEEKPNERTE